MDFLTLHGYGGGKYNVNDELLISSVGLLKEEIIHTINPTRTSKAFGVYGKGLNKILINYEGVVKYLDINDYSQSTITLNGSSLTYSAPLVAINENDDIFYAANYNADLPIAKIAYGTTQAEYYTGKKTVDNFDTKIVDETIYQAWRNSLDNYSYLTRFDGTTEVWTIRLATVNNYNYDIILKDGFLFYNNRKFDIDTALLS